MGIKKLAKYSPQGNTVNQIFDPYSLVIPRPRLRAMASNNYLGKGTVRLGVIDDHMARTTRRRYYPPQLGTSDVHGQKLRQTGPFRSFLVTARDKIEQSNVIQAIRGRTCTFSKDSIAS